MTRRMLSAVSAIATGAALFAVQPLAFAKEGDPDARSRVPPAEPIGEPVTCINIASIRNSHVRDDRTIDFVLTGGRVMRNELPYRCNSLGFEEAFSYATSLSQLCNTDIITVLRQTGGRLDPGPSCGLGKFQPVKLIKPEKSK